MSPCVECSGKCCKDDLGYRIKHMAAEFYDHVCEFCLDGDAVEIPHEDLTVRELHCECHLCPTGCTCFNFRVPTTVIDQLRSEPDLVFFHCPRGHDITWVQVRGTSAVDDAGYTIDRSHPLWRVG